MDWGKGQMHLRQRRKKEHATNVESMDISHESAKMAAKRDATAEHGEVQHVTEAEAEQERAAMAEGAETFGSKEPARASRAAKEQTHG